MCCVMYSQDSSHAYYSMLAGEIGERDDDDSDATQSPQWFADGMSKVSCHTSSELLCN